MLFYSRLFRLLRDYQTSGNSGPKVWSFGRDWNERQQSVRQRQKTTDREAGDSSRERQRISRQRCGQRQWEIKRGASGCQVDQNKHWVPCRQRARSSQTDTKLDPPLFSSEQHNTVTTSSVNLRLCLFEENAFFFSLFLSLLSGLWFPTSPLSFDLFPPFILYLLHSLNPFLPPALCLSLLSHLCTVPPSIPATLPPIDCAALFTPSLSFIIEQH